MKRSKRVHTVVSVVVIATLLGLVGVLWYLNSVESSVVRTDVPVITDTPSEITDFASCVAAGNPIMESFPEQCSADGQTYTNQEQAEDPTQKWLEFVSEEGDYSLRYPTDWVKAANLELCNPGLLLLGADEASVGKCASESFGQMRFSSRQDDGSDRSLLAQGFTNVAQDDVIIDGVQGVTYSGEAPNPDTQEFSLHAPGTKVTQYIFKHDDKIFTAVYVAEPSYPDVLDEFHLVVQRTLQFN